MSLRLKNDFKSMNHAELERSAIAILGAMTSNANFTAPVPSVEDMSEVVSDYTVSLNECKNGDRVKIAEKNDRRLVLLENLEKWRLYVLLESNGDQAKALSSGFSLVPARSARPPLEKPQALVITPGKNQGEIVCQGKPVSGATNYQFEFGTLEEMTTNRWNQIPSTKTRQVISSLTRGVLYYCRIGAFGKNNQVIYSDVTSRMAA